MQIHPGDAMDKDLYDLPDSELKGIPTVSASLRESLKSLDNDQRLFESWRCKSSDNLIDAYISSLQMDEVLQLNIRLIP